PMSKLNKMEGFPEGFRIEASKTQQDPCKMFVGGLSREVNKQVLLQYLSQFGEIIDFTIKIDPDTGLSRGFGFVLFKDSTAVEKALQVKEHKLDDKKIELKKAKALESRFPPKKVFVGGVNPRMSEAKIREYFSTFGEIENIELPVCPRTNERRAFCFITYTDEKPVRKLLETRYHLIGSGRCEIKIALPKEHMRAYRNGGRYIPFSGLGNYWGGGGSFHENPREGFNFSDQLFSNFHNTYSNQSVFTGYGDYFSGHNCGTQELTCAFPNYRMQINETTFFSSSYQGIYRPF
uniref:RRM domain-containing protein n=1 Tax=Otolemur garnettii TaxID=30611 RepID=H0XXD5_OTOGA